MCISHLRFQRFLPAVIKREFWSSSESSPRPHVVPGKTFSIVMPQVQEPQFNPDNLPNNVTPPLYYRTGTPGISPPKPEVKSAEDIQKMRNSCRLARRILDEAGELAKPGITTALIDQLVTRLCFEAGAYPSPLNYRHFPKSVCTSVNNVVCHGIPDIRPLENGDLINIDVTVFLDNFHGDCSKTFLVGDVDEGGQMLVDVAEKALYEGISAVSPGGRFCDIGNSIEKFVREAGFKVIPSFTGHGIGQYFHGPPDIFPCRNSYPGIMEPGNTFTIEPAISEGSSGIRILKDRWTAVSPDNSRSAQFEHTVLVTNEGAEILTELS